MINITVLPKVIGDKIVYECTCIIYNKKVYFWGNTEMEAFDQLIEFVNYTKRNLYEMQ